MKNELGIEIGKIAECPICGKKFIPTYGWVYKTTSPTRLYCSYTCWRNAGGDGLNEQFKNRITRKKI